MSKRTNRSTGCWTCRARRKRCDGKTPACETCRRLGIVCAEYDSERPIWMDGGGLQQEFCRKLTASIRQRNKARNDTDVTSNGSTSIDESLMSWNEFDTQYLSSSQCPGQALDTTEVRSLVYADLGWLSDPQMNWVSGFENANIQLVESPSEKDFSFPSTEIPLPCSNPSEKSNHQSHAEDMEDFLIMRYFDHTFYQIFPYHCWQAQEAQRGWLLSRSRRSKALRPALLSTISFQYDDHQISNSSLLLSVFENGSTQWQAYYRQALSGNEVIMIDVNSDNSLTQQAKLRLSMDGLGCIVHLISLANLGAHIDGCEQNLEHGFKLIDIITKTRNSLNLISECGEGTEKEKVNVPEVFTWVDVQLFDLFSSIVIRHYVLFCASISNPPSNHPQLDRLLDGENMDMKTLYGCSRQVLKAITQITKLRLWKQDAIHESRLSVLELARRAIIVEERLREELKTLQINTTVHQGMISCTGKKLNHGLTSKPCQLHGHLSIESAKMLGYTAQIYLHAIVSGPNPNLPEIHENLTLCKKGLRTMAELQVRPVDLIWSVCVMCCVLQGPEDLSQEIYEYFSGTEATKQLSMVDKMLKRIGEAWQIGDIGRVCDWISLTRNF